MKKVKKVPIGHPYRAVLRRCGIKATPARLAVLTYLAKVRKPMSKMRISRNLAAPMDSVTVYRVLTDLEKAGLIRQVDFGHRHAHYEITDGEDHHHLICMRCHRVEDFSGCNFFTLKKKALRQTSGFSTITKHSIELFGLCRSCDKK